MQAQAYVHKHGMKLEQELAHARRSEQEITNREAKLEQRIASMSKDLNARMDELHSHDKTALDHQRTIRQQTKNHENLLDATTTEIQKRDQVIKDLRQDAARLREKAKSVFDSSQVLQHPEYLALRQISHELESTPIPEYIKRCAKLYEEVQTVTALRDEAHARLRSSRCECDILEGLGSSTR